MTFIMFFTGDIISISKIGFSLSDEFQLAARIISISILGIFFIYELLDIKLRGRSEYFESLWNLNDQLIVLAYIAYLVILYVDSSYIYALKSLQLVIVMMSFIKFCFIIRIFTKLSFLVQMLYSVFYDLRYFLTFFALVIGAFSIML